MSIPNLKLEVAAAFYNRIPIEIIPLTGNPAGPTYISNIVSLGEASLIQLNPVEGSYDNPSTSFVQNGSIRV